MEKKKFNLTSDIVDISSDKNIDIAKGEEVSKATTAPNRQDKYVSLTVGVQESLKREYKIWCVENRMNMSEAFKEGFSLLKIKYSK